MTQSGARTMPVRTGDIGTSGDKRSVPPARRGPATTARRRWLVLFALVALVVVAILANIGPITHYQEARARLDRASGKVDALKAQKAELQGQVAKLAETGYLETMAREQLTYVRPGEDLYIITESAGEAEGASGGPRLSPTVTSDVVTASGLGAAAVALGDSGAAAGAEGQIDADGPTTDSAGFLERTLNAIRELF